MDFKKVEIRIEANEPGVVFDVAKRLKEKLPGHPRVIPDRERRIVSVEGAPVDDVRVAMKRYVAACGKGHGGYRFNYVAEEVVVSERDVVEAEVSARFCREIEGLKETAAVLEVKWGKERKEYRDRIAELRESLAEARRRGEEAELASASRAAGLAAARDEIRRLGERIADLERLPLRRVIASRLKRFFRRGSRT